MKKNTLVSKLLCTAGIALLFAGNAQADIVNFTNATPAGVNIDNGTLASFTAPADGNVITSLIYTVNGLDIDGEGLNNDTITVTVPFSPINGTTINANPSSANELDIDGGVFRVGEGISYGAITVSGASSTGLAYQLDSALYQQFTFRRFANGDDGGTIVGDVSNITAPNGQSANNLNDTTFVVTTTSGTNNVGNIDFTIDVSTVAAVPEPSSMAILAAGMGLIVTRRRRK